MNALLAMFVVILIALGLIGATPQQSTVYASSDGDDVTTEKAPSIPQHVIADDPRTWPSGNRVWDCCRAIAYAEGYNVPNSVPARLNNPGDISDGSSTFGNEFHSGSHVTTFPDANTGWSWLYTKISRAANGNSSVYDPSMSWREIGAKWAPPNAEVWASNVAGALGVDADSSLGDYINAGV